MPTILERFGARLLARVRPERVTGDRSQPLPVPASFDTPANREALVAGTRFEPGRKS